MYIQVRLLKGFPEPLLYEIPQDWGNQNLVGRIVKVPIKTQLRSALVLKQLDNLPANNSFTIRPAQAIEPFPEDAHYIKFIAQLSAYYQVESLHFIKRIQQFLVEKEMTDELPLLNDTPEDEQNKKISLTDEQTKVVDFVASLLDTPQFSSTLLHGVTGSGKTEVYKQLIIKNFGDAKTTLLLLPEVTLAIQFEKIMRAKLPSIIPIYGFHSATTAKQKRLLWQALLHQKPMLIIGVHLPILLPLPNLGLIIVDEEHEVGYQEKKHPKVNSKEAAIWRANMHQIPILLGSATPSLSSLYNVKTKGWHFFQLKKRFAGSFPQITVVSLADKKQRKNFWISKKMEDAIKERLAKKEQAIIFLNRRGYSFFVQCKACTFIFECSNCSVSLTLHSNNHLACHYCGLSFKTPAHCPKCKATESEFLKKGIGTQQVVSILEKLFPHARIARADMDTTSKKKTWHETVHAFETGQLDILVGTQTITKGYHFPNVTLVGILWADLNLHFPMFNAAETTLQQLIQVAGRAGRQREGSSVIVQTMIDHPIFQFLNEIDYIRFYTHEMEHRSELGYPPYKRLVEIELKHMQESVVELDANKLMNSLLDINDAEQLGLQLLGPAKPPVHKIKNTFARKIYIKGQSMQTIMALFQSVNKGSFKSQIYFTPNPVT